MARTLRVDEPGLIYHVTNRGNGRMTLFHKDGDFAAFEKVLAEGLARYPVDLLSWCLMHNHWHLVLGANEPGAMAKLMQWIGVTHVRRHHAHYKTRGGGHLYQGRYKSFPIEVDPHLLQVLRYVEANALRAGLVERAQDWRWSGLFNRLNPGGLLEPASWPLDVPRNWIETVNEPIPKKELEEFRTLHVNRGRPFGSDEWTRNTAQNLGLMSTIRPTGRPTK